MIESFKDKASEDIFNGVDSKQARKACPRTLWRIAARKLDQLDSVVALDEFGWRVCQGTVAASAVSELTNSIVYALNGAMQDRLTLKLQITIKRWHYAYTY